MYLLGYSLDNLSLMALTLSVGFVVDDAIVMLENIVRHMEMGKTPMQAAFDGSKEIAFTIVSMTLSLAAVFIPVLFMGGVVGRLLHEFAVTIGVAILVSGFVSISLTPMLCSRFLKPPHAQKHGWFYNATERMFDAWLQALRRDAAAEPAVPRRDDGACRSRCSSARSTCSALVPKGFLPSEDQGRFNISTEAIQGIGFDEMVRHQQAGRRHRRQGSERRRLQQQRRRRARRRRPEPRAASSIDLKPRDRAEADRSTRSSRELRPKLAQVPGVRVFMVNQPPINLGGQQGARSLYQFTLQDTDTDGAVPVGAGARSEDARAAGHRGRQQRPADQEPAGPASTSTATRSRRSA